MDLNSGAGPLDRRVESAPPTNLHGTAPEAPGESARVRSSGVGAAVDAYEPISGRELSLLALLLLALHLFFWARYWPLPHYDLNAYMEPGLLLGQEGRLIAPGSQHMDLTLTQAAYFYPPGYALFLGAWVAAFGSGVRALLAYTHTVHFLYLICLWVLIRGRFRCDRGASLVTLASAFPFFAHGRPDLTSLTLGAGAWLLLPYGAMPTRRRIGATVASSVLLGLSVLVSPAFGTGSAVMLATVLFLHSGPTLAAKVRGLATLVVGSVATFLGVWAAVLTWQSAWTFGPEQFVVNLLVRGRELNTLDIPATLYSLAFIAVPVVFLTLGPAVLVATLRRRVARTPLWIAAVSYAGGFFVWLIVNSQQLLVQHHFTYLARVPFHGALASRASPFRGFGWVVLLAFTAIHFYFQKGELLYLFSDLPAAYSRAAAQEVGEDEIAAVDSPFFPVLYRAGRTLNYEVVAGSWWTRFRDATSPAIFGSLPDSVRRGPVEPDVLVISALTIVRAGIPDTSRYRHVGPGGTDVPLRTLMGRPIAMPKHPLEPYRFVRVTER